MSEGQYGERIAKLEAKTDSIEKRLDDLSEIKTAVTQLTLLSEQQAEYNKRYEKTQAKFCQHLETINTNLSNLNNSAELTNKRLSDLEGKFECIDEKSKVDIVKIIVWTVPGLLGAGLTFFILKIAGLIVF